MANPTGTIPQHPMQTAGERHLLVSATCLEVKPLLEKVFHHVPDASPGKPIPLPGTGFDLLITGTGIVAMAFHSALMLQGSMYSLAINAGVAGSFNPAFNPGTLVWVMKDRFADLGLESPDGFVTGEKLPITLADKPPWQNGWLVPGMPARFPVEDLPACVAVTSDTIHTKPDSIQRIRDLYQADIETMEGAAFFYACLQSNVPCVQIRAVSNMAAPRDEASWQLDRTIGILNDWLIPHISTAI